MTEEEEFDKIMREMDAELADLLDEGTDVQPRSKAHLKTPKITGDLIASEMESFIPRAGETQHSTLKKLYPEGFQNAYIGAKENIFNTKGWAKNIDTEALNHIIAKYPNAPQSFRDQLAYLISHDNYDHGELSKYATATTGKGDVHIRAPLASEGLFSAGELIRKDGTLKAVKSSSGKDLYDYTTKTGERIIVDADANLYDASGNPSTNVNKHFVTGGVDTEALLANNKGNLESVISDGIGTNVSTNTVNLEDISKMSQEEFNQLLNYDYLRTEEVGTGNQRTRFDRLSPEAQRAYIESIYTDAVNNPSNHNAQEKLRQLIAGEANYYKGENVTGGLASTEINELTVPREHLDANIQGPATDLKGGAATALDRERDLTRSVLGLREDQLNSSQKAHVNKLKGMGILKVVGGALGTVIALGANAADLGFSVADAANITNKASGGEGLSTGGYFTTAGVTAGTGAATYGAAKKLGGQGMKQLLTKGMRFIPGLGWAMLGADAAMGAYDYFQLPAEQRRQMSAASRAESQQAMNTVWQNPRQQQHRQKYGVWGASHPSDMTADRDIANKYGIWGGDYGNVPESFLDSYHGQ